MAECVTIVVRKRSYKALRSCIFGCTAGEFHVAGPESQFESITVTSDGSSLQFNVLTRESASQEFAAQIQGLTGLVKSAAPLKGERREPVEKIVAGAAMLIGVVGTPRLDSVRRGEDAIYTIAEELNGVILTSSHFVDANGNELLAIAPPSDEPAGAVAVPEIDDTPAGREMAKEAKQIAAALCKSGYAADFSMQSLHEIDRFIDEHVVDGQPRPQGLLSRDLGRRLFAIGAYIGEVVRRRAGGRWTGDPGSASFELDACLEVGEGTSCWPTQKAIKRFKGGAIEGIAAWGQGCVEYAGSSPQAAGGSLISSSRIWVRDRKGMLVIGLGAWLLLGFLGGWYPILAVLSLVSALLLAAGLLVASWWQTLQYAWKYEPKYVLHFLTPLYFIRYGMAELPKTKRPMVMLLAGLAVALGSILILIPVQMAGAAVARTLAAAPVNARPAEPPPRRPDDSGGDRPEGGPLANAKKLETVDDALTALASDQRSVRSKALHFLKQAPADPSRTEVADALLANRSDRVDDLTVDAVIRWSSTKHYDSMRDLTHQLKGYSLQKLLARMMAVDPKSTLDLCGKLFVDADRRSVARAVLNEQGAVSETVLIPLAQHESADVRYAAAEMLAVHGSSAALVPLQEQGGRERDRTTKATIDFAIREIERRTRLQPM